MLQIAEFNDEHFVHISTSCKVLFVSKGFFIKGDSAAQTSWLNDVFVPEAI